MNLDAGYMFLGLVLVVVTGLVLGALVASF